MFPAQCRQPVRAVLAGIFVVADADQCFVQQPHYRPDKLTPGQVTGAQVAFHALPQRGSISLNSSMRRNFD